MEPTRPSPASSMAKVSGSGTAVTLMLSSAVYEYCVSPGSEQMSGYAVLKGAEYQLEPSSRLFKLKAVWSVRLNVSDAHPFQTKLFVPFDALGALRHTYCCPVERKEKPCVSIGHAFVLSAISSKVIVSAEAKEDMTKLR